jgi:hypothetical protein
MFDSNKEYSIGVYDLSFYVVDEANNVLSHPDYLKQALSHLAIVCDHANEDCPEEYRTKWFNPALEEAYSFLQKMSEVEND